MSYAAVPAQVVSIAGGQASGTITAYRDTNNQTIALAEPGIVTASALFRDEQRADSTLTWVLRAVGYVAMLIGFVGLTRRRRAVPHPLAAPQRIAPNE